MKTARPSTLAAAKAALRKHANPKKAQVYRGYFKDAGEDIFLGVTVPLIRTVAKAHWTLPLPAVRKLMASKVHDERALANAIQIGRAHV